MVSTTASACAIPVRVGVGVRVRIRVRIGVRVRVGVRGRVRVRVRVSLSLRDPGGRELRRADEVAGSVHTGGTCHEVRPHRDVAVRPISPVPPAAGYQTKVPILKSEIRKLKTEL